MGGPGSGRYPAIPAVPTREVRAQPGLQEIFLASNADIAIAGGSAGCGKTTALLFMPLGYVHLPEFQSVIFRRVMPEVTNPGGLWDESMKYYPSVGAEPKQNPHEWWFPSGARVRFSHMQYEHDQFSWRGSQIPLIEFDQLELFTERQFWPMLHPNRDPSGLVVPCLRATCNPVPSDDAVGGWLHRLITWWLDDETGLPRWERRGALRWFVRINDEIIWADDPNALRQRHAGAEPKSLTFIPGRIEVDNPKLLEANPEYMANLLSLPLVERERLLGGNWNARPVAGKVFNRGWFEIVGAAPAERECVRYWDLAATQGGGNWTAGVLMSRAPSGVFFIEDVHRGQWGPMQRNLEIKQTAQLDSTEIPVWVPQDPGSGGKEAALILIAFLAGFAVRSEPVTGSKLARANPLAAQAQAGNVKLIAGAWNAPFLHEAHYFDGSDSCTDDQIDGASGAFAKLTLGAGADVRISAAGQPLPLRRVTMRI